MGNSIAVIAVIAAATAFVGTPARLIEANQQKPAQLNIINCVEPIEKYLNNIKTARARFRQVSSTGDVANGSLYIKRPGLIRLEYDPPVPVLIVSDGFFLIYYDRQLAQVTHLPLSSTPASILTREKAFMPGDDIIIKGCDEHEGTIRLTLVLRDIPEAGEIALIFDTNPVHLTMWSVADASGVTTDVSLKDLDLNVTLVDTLFQLRKD